jgi:type I restriction enzyme S subunit
MSGWTTLPVGSRSVNLDRRRVPVKSSDRRPGPYPYFGASGVVDHVDDYLFDGLHLLVAEDGENLRSRKTPIAFLADGRFWVNNHAHILRANESNDLCFLAYALEATDIAGYITGSAQPKLTQAALASIPISAPSLKEQQGIAATLGALDSMIESNRRLRVLLRTLGAAELQAALVAGANQVPLREVTISILRGVAPRYASDEPEAPLVVNQRCVRDGFVSTGAARRMVAKEVPPNKRVTDGDILVNSTGMGTLGRVGRWHSGEVFADSHVSIVKPDPAVVGPTVLAYALFGRESDIEGMATGSTGQTELSPSLLGDLALSLPTAGAMDNLDATLSTFEGLIASSFAQDTGLTSLRDTLLPELLSGRIRVAEESESVEEGVA